MADEATQQFVPVLPTGVQYELHHGEQRAVVTEVGAALRAYEVGGRAFVDGFEAEEIPTGGRGQVLIPWPNRIAGGSYEFGGARQQLAIGEVRNLNASHGLVRSANFAVIARDEAGVTLGLILHPQSGYPFALAIELDYRLDEAGLHVTTSVRNVGATALPFGIGFHPYFTVGTALIDEATFTLPAATALTTDERMIPTGREAVDGTPLDFRTPRPIGDTILDSCFTNLARDADGSARITLAGANGAPTLTLTLDKAFGFVQVYSGNNLPDPARRRQGLAIEPMTCPANAFNSGEGVIVLEPGERFAATWSLSVTE